MVAWNGKREFMNHAKQKQKGFTILEVVVAFSILSVVTVITVGVVTQNTMRTHKIEKRLMAMSVAENAVAEIGVKILFSKLEGVISYKGKSSGELHWNASVNKHETTLDYNVKNILPLWDVDLKVFHKKQVLFNLLTVVPGK